MSNFILRGPQPTYTTIEKGFGEYFFEQAEIHGEKIFQIDGATHKSESFYHVRQRSTRVALYLKKIGIKPRDVVMICCRNNIHNIIPALAGLYLGAYISAVEPKQSVSEVIHAITLLDPSILFVEENSLPLVEESLKSCNKKPDIVVIGKSEKYVQMFDLEVEHAEEKAFKPLNQKGSDICAIVFSSGTTSAAKGIHLSNSYILNTSEPMNQHNHLKPGVVSHVLSLYGVSAWIYTAFCTIHGIPKVVLPSADAEKFLQLVEQYKITYIFTSSLFTYAFTNLPEVLIRKYDTSSLQCMCVSGSTIDPSQILRLRKLFPHTKVALGYGSTETGFIACHNFSVKNAYEKKVSSSGTVIPGRELKIVDMDSGKLLGPNQFGEIRIKSPTLLAAYHNLGKPDNFDKDGFYKMGDMGYYDQENYVYVTDRLSDTFKYRTTRISPSLIDHVLLTHPKVVEAVSFGVPHSEDGSHAAACVVLKKGSELTAEELLEFVNDKVDDDNYKLRAGILIVESIPRTAGGKIVRWSSRDLFIESYK